jgi:hypothetical protein
MKSEAEDVLAQVRLEGAEHREERRYIRIVTITISG